MCRLPTPSARWALAAELDQALKLATYLKPAKGAARELAEGNDPLKMAEQIRARYGNDAVIMTAGASGCAISASDTSVRVPAFKVKVVDTTGAGDAFLGGVLAGLLWKLKWPEIGRLANASARDRHRQARRVSLGLRVARPDSEVVRTTAPGARIGPR